MTERLNTPQKDVLFLIGDWNAKVGSQEISGVTGKFGFGVQNEAGQRLTEFCQENTLVIARAWRPDFPGGGGVPWAKVRSWGLAMYGAEAPTPATDACRVVGC